MEKKKQGSAKERIVHSAWELFYTKGYDNTTVDDIIVLSGTSKGSFYYYFDSKDALLSTLSTILDDKYLELKEELPKDMNTFEQLMYINYEAHKLIEEKIDRELLANMYSTQLTTKGERHLLDQNRVYYRLIQDIIIEGQIRGEISRDKTVSEIGKLYGICERALISDWCLCQGNYSLAEYSKEYMPIMMKHFRL